ncbi:hypothetical protein H072_9849 [Dactylellina haptotyla CBS 200.50]|uniref:Nudix hydrolase domain-containing protein n=1 Tax=Dactylellina haptotyla (strain CBS 200.50) TaxID=1284197 RepID=S8A1J8_DACHA|nr:hypothetical protein H072_9849 [Dactylellina haptotyla CBS 200.50]
MISERKNTLTALGLVSKVDSWPYYRKDPELYRKKIADFYYIMVKGYPKPFGHIYKTFVEEQAWPETSWELNHEKRFLTLICESNFETRTNALNAAVLAWQKDPAKTSTEMIPFYYSDTMEHVADISRTSILGLFGILDSAVHVVAFTNTHQGRKYWIARRAPTKRLWPNLLDNAVTGGIPSGEKPIDTVIRESREEANLSEEYTRSHAKFIRMVTYSPENILNLKGGVMHHRLFVYEIELENGVVPTPDGQEVENYNLYTLDEVKRLMLDNEFMPILKMTWTALFIHHGVIIPENEPHFDEINARLSRKFDFFVLE